jgi:FdhE protein
MPYVALPLATRASRRALADARWNAILLVRPDLAPAIDLQRKLIGPVIDVADRIAQGRLPRLSLPAKYVAAKLTKGIPALAAEPIPMPTALLKPTLLELCRELANGGAGESAEHIRTAIDAGTLEAGSLLTASLSRDQKAIKTGGVHRGLAPDLLWLVAELAVSPFAHALQQMLLHPHGQPAPDAVLQAALDGWRQGYCPFCGSWPALVECLDGTRILRCSFCALAWSLADAACLYCGESGEGFASRGLDRSQSDRRLETCATCRSYVKAVDTDELLPFPLVAIGDLETMDLDVQAMQQGFQRPALRAFGATTTLA